MRPDAIRLSSEWGNVQPTDSKSGIQKIIISIFSISKSYRTQDLTDYEMIPVGI